MVRVPAQPLTADSGGPSPSQASSTTTRYAFGPFVADVRTGVLRRDGAELALTPKTFEVLATLIRRAGELVSKDDLFREVWPDTVVEENNLARQISTLRKVLEERVDDHRFIVTVPGRGYRFVAEVTPILAVPAPVAGPQVPESTASAASPSHVTAERNGAPWVPALRQGKDSRSAADTRRWTGAVVVALALAGAWWLVRPPGSVAPAQRNLWQLTFDAALKSEPAFSPDGRWVTYAADLDGNSDIWVHPVNGGEPRRLTSSPAHDWQPAWSPDGDTIAWRSERDGGGVYLVGAFGGSERRVAPFGYRPRWSPDGTKILIYDSVLVNTIETQRLLLVPVDGGPPREVLAGVVAKAKGVRAAWHPDGRLSMWVTVRGGQQEFWTVPVDRDDVVVSRLDPGVERRLVDAGVKLIDFVWSPSGRELFFEGRSRGVSNLWRVKVDPGTLAWTDGPERLTTGPGKDTGLAVSATGQALAFSIRSDRTRLWQLPFDATARAVTGPGRPISGAEADASFPEVSADGRQVLYRRVRPGHEGLWLLDMESGADTLVVEAVGGQFVGLPRWAPGGTLFAHLRSAPQVGREPGSPIASAEIAASMQALQVVVRSLAGQERVVGLPSNVTMLVTDWSADGQVMYGACRAVPDGLAWVCALPAPGAEGGSPRPTVITERSGHSLYQARLSPDGRWVSFTAIDVRRPSVATVYVMPREGGAWTAVTEGQAFDDKLRWAHDGRTVYFVSNRGGLFDLRGRAFDPVAGRPAGESFPVTHFQTPGRTILASLAEMEWALSPRGLVLPITESSAQIWLLNHVDQ